MSNEVQEQPDFLVNIAPTGHTRTGRQIQPPSCFAYTAYHFCFLAQSCLTSIVDFHPLASLQAFAANISQPDGYPDAMPLHVALAQPDWDKFIASMEEELKQHSELKHWKIIHKT